MFIKLLLHIHGKQISIQKSQNVASLNDANNVPTTFI